MKKLMSTLSLAAVIATTANADFLRVEMGAGAWQQVPNSSATASDGSGLLKLNGDYYSNDDAKTSGYFWAILKHPLPVVPNLRVEYAATAEEGSTDGTVNGYTLSDIASTKLETTQIDVIPYYNLLDNTFWITVDLGLDLKIVQTDATVEKIANFPGYSDDENLILPLVYLRGRVQVPATGLGAEADVKYITDGDSTVYDIRAKVDYTFDIFPVVQPGIEIGYRMEKADRKDGSYKVNLDYQGVYVGAMLRF